MKVTMSDIAHKMGVSTATVSLALNNSPKVAPATRKKIIAVAESMGYHSNPYVSALMSARRQGKEPAQTPVIAMITPTREKDDWKGRYHLSRFVEGCTDRMKSMGIRPEFFWIGDEKLTARRLNEVLINRGVRGAILMTHGVWGEKLDYPWENVATICYGVRHIEPDTDWVAADFYGNMEKSLEILRQNKLERIGFVMDKPFPYQHHNRWLAAYLMEQERGRIQRIRPWVDDEPSFEGFAEWVEATKPDSIICVRPPTVIDWLQKLGLDVPGDIGVAAIGTAEADGEISGMVENTRTAGKLAVEMLLERIHRGEFGCYTEPHHVSVSGRWNRGRRFAIAQNSRTGCTIRKFFCFQRCYL